MDPYQAAAVWQRVRQSTPEDSTQRILTEMIGREILSRDTYLAMSRLGYSSFFRQLAEQEACHARRLSALYYLLYGTHPKKADPQCPKSCDLCESIRSAFLHELEAAKGYRRLAQTETEHAALFLALAKDEERHAARLRCLAERLLCSK